MAVFRVLDKYIVSEAEYRAKQGPLTAFMAARDAGKPIGAFALSGGRMLATAPPPPTAAPTEFPPIGYGKPLTILIRHVYTGSQPDNGFFSSDADVAVVSGVRNYEVFNASTRALNIVAQNLSPHAHITRPETFTEGSIVVSYSPAIMTDSLTISLELAVATFPQAFVNALSSAFTSLAGIPLLLPYAGYLLGAGQLFKLAGNVGHALFDGVKFAVSDSIDFDLPGAIPASADFRVLTSDNFRNEAQGLQYHEGKGLVDASNAPYEGDEPYIVLSLDGKQRDNLKSFVPSVASAAILQRFFQAQSGGQVAIDTMVQGLTLASDFKYREQALALKAKLADATEPEKTQIQQQLAAALKNISTDALKP
jgi:hypothetical protein